MGTGRLAYPFPLWVLGPAVLVSGATALAYEIVWTRRLALVLGSTTAAVVAVLSVFMLGLALGAVVIGRRADTSRQPLRWYGLLEIGIGLFAIAFDSLLDLAGGGLFASCALLLLPTALMGGTLPVLARAGSHTTERGTFALGSLYGINTLGAVVGALLATLVFIEAWGLRGTVIAASIVNLALGLLFWGFSRVAGERPVYATGEDSGARGWSGDAGLTVIFAFFLAGFAGLSLQIAWFRLLIYFLEGFTIAFGLMLAAYLLGLGAGALAGSPLALRSRNPRRLLAHVLLLYAVLALATFPLAAPLGAWLEEMRSTYQTAEGMDFGYGLRLFGAALAIVFPATFCSGMLMPVVARLTFSNRESIGRHAGVVYAAGTLGAVVAPPVASFYLVPTFTVPVTIALCAALLLAAGTMSALARGARAYIAAGAATVALVALSLASGLDRPVVRSSHVFQATKSPRRLLEFREGFMAGVSVVEELKNGSRRLYLDDFSAAETGSHYGYMRLLGHLPVLLHQKPERALVIAFGTGTTAGATAIHPEVKEVVCVEIEPAVFEVAHHFNLQSRHVLDSPKVRRVVADGREYVARGSEKFDVITLEPLMPYTPAAVYLYTREFYEEARRSLHRDGLLCQWIPPQGVSPADMKRLIASMTAVFPHVSLWYFEHAVLVLGAPARPNVDWPSFFARTAQRDVAEDLQAARVGGPAHLMGAFVVGGEALEKALEGVEPMVDDRTDLEFRPVPRRFGKLSMSYHAGNLELLAKVRQPTMDWFGEPNSAAIVAREVVGEAMQSLAIEMRHRVDGGTVVPSSQLARALERDPGALFARSIYERRLYDELLAAQRAEEAARLALAPDRSAAYLMLAAEAEGTKKIYYLTLAVRDHALCDATALEVLGKALSGAEQRFCLNRLRALRGEALEEGDEILPSPQLPDVAPALADFDEDAAREILEDAEKAGLRNEVEARIESWWSEVKDRRRGALFLHRIGSRHALRVALKMMGTDDEEDLVAIAPMFAANYPAYPYWERLCAHRRPRVREAAADAARGTGGRAHLPGLAGLLQDPEEGVRLSAWISFRGIAPEAAEIPYDPRAPSAESVATATKLAAAQ